MGGGAAEGAYAFDTIFDIHVKLTSSIRRRRSNRRTLATLSPHFLTKSVGTRGCVYDALVSGPRRHKEAAARADGAAERASGRGGAPGRLRRE